MRRGYVNLFLGSMRSGKSSELFKILDHTKYRGLKSILIRPDTDDRDFISRRYNTDDMDFDVLVTGSLKSIINDLKTYNVICIDEGQFIEDLDLCHQLALKGKEVYIAALNGDAEMRPWKSIGNVLPFVDNIKRFSGICEECKEDAATFSYYTKKKDHQIEIGDGEYMILCRECYDKLSKKRDAKK